MIEGTLDVGHLNKYFKQKILNLHHWLDWIICFLFFWIRSTEIKQCLILFGNFSTANPDIINSHHFMLKWYKDKQYWFWIVKLTVKKFLKVTTNVRITKNFHFCLPKLIIRKSILHNRSENCGDKCLFHEMNGNV